jgi:phosphopentomutase
MPAPTYAIIIAPLAQITAVQTEWGITISPTAPVLYVAADPVPRVATHKVRSGSATLAQRALIASHIESPNPNLEGVIAALWVVDQPNPYQQMLTDNGLTQSQNM